MDGEIAYHQERLDNPRRVFFDLEERAPGRRLCWMRPSSSRTIRCRKSGSDGIPQNTTRVVMDMSGVDDYSVFTLYNPYRVVVDFHRSGAPVAAVPRLPVASACFAADQVRPAPSRKRQPGW